MMFAFAATWLLLAFTAALGLLHYISRDTRTERLTKNMPTVHAFKLICKAFRASFSERSHMLLQMYRYGKHATKITAVGMRATLLFYKPEHLQKILNSKYMLDRSFGVNFLRPILENNDNLLASGTTIWRSRRRIIAPHFNPFFADNAMDSIRHHVRVFLVKMKSRGGLKWVEKEDIFKYVLNCIYDNTVQVVFAHPSTMQGSDSDDIYNLFARINTALTKKMSTIWGFLDAIHRPNKFYPYERKELETLNKVILEMVKPKKVKFIQEMNDFQDSEPSTAYAQLPLLDDLVLRHLKGELTELDLLNESKVVFLAGVETTSLSICYILMMLGMHPKVQEKVYEEVVAGLSHYDDPLTASLSDLNNLEYTNCVVKETLRLFPAVPLGPKKATQDVRLDDDIVIPKGCDVFVHFFGLHRSPDNWEDPLEFKPERFLPENSQNRHPCAFLPFSTGARNCVGYRLAKNILSLAVPVIVLNFRAFTEYKTVEEIKTETSGTMRPSDGFKVTLEPR